MVDLRLIRYIEKYRDLGYSDDQLKAFLVKMGYGIKEVDSAFGTLNRPKTWWLKYMFIGLVALGVIFIIFCIGYLYLPARCDDLACMQKAAEYCRNARAEIGYHSQNSGLVFDSVIEYSLKGGKRDCVLQANLKGVNVKYADEFLAKFPALTPEMIESWTVSRQKEYANYIGRNASCDVSAQWIAGSEGCLEMKSSLFDPFNIVTFQ